VIPFYFEIRETPQWIVSYSKKFFITFICQYLAFKSRNLIYLKYNEDYGQLVQAAKKEKLDYLVRHIKGFEYSENRIGL
jgi:hypothetical protein